ncbi:MAG: FAD-dependent monooxygenase [Actinomycetota bacterium]|nr:FAD-dependent monooxygenase [Actinomycetota bacterium]
MTESTTIEETDAVVIVGAGPIGLGVSLELALRGIRSIVLESRAKDTHYAMRSNLTNLRSMEHFRRWGIADRLRANDPIDPEFKRDVTWVTGLNGHVVVNFEGAFDFDQVPFAAEVPEWAPTTAIEKTMQDEAQTRTEIDLRFECEVTGVEQEADTVSVTYRQGAGELTLRAPYLVAADGSRSPIRRQLGVKLEGTPDLVQSSIWLIEAPDLIERSVVGRSSFYFFINEHRDAALMIVQDSDRGHYMFMVLPASEGADPADWEATRQILYRNVGYEFPVKPLAGGHVRVHSMIAPRFDHGRVFLAGDAAHLISPMGGFGMNIGIGDAVDLGWKLAATIQGWGGEKLLRSYGEERGEAVRWIQQECIDNTAILAPELVEDGISADAPSGDEVRARVAQRIIEEKTKEFISTGAQLGYRYTGSPIIVPNGQAPPLSMADYVPSATPGCRAPHIWLKDGSSLYDHFGPGFTLLKLDRAVNTSALEEAAATRGVPLKVLFVEEEQMADLYGVNLALVRPDQHIAWRGEAAPEDPLEVIDIVRGA